MSTPTAQLAAAGVSIWLDDLSRTRISSGNLAELIETRNVTGVTTNPSLILKAVQKPEYAPLLKDTVAKWQGRAMDEVIDRLLVRFGCEILTHVPGRVSTEVDARLSFDTSATVTRAERIARTKRMRWRHHCDDERGHETEQPHRGGGRASRGNQRRDDDERERPHQVFQGRLAFLTGFRRRRRVSNRRYF